MSMEVRHEALTEDGPVPCVTASVPVPLTPEARHALALAPLPECTYVLPRIYHAGRGVLTYSQSRDRS